MHSQHLLAKNFALLLLFLQLLVKHPFCQLVMAAFEVVKCVDESSKMSLSTQLLLKPCPCQPVSSMGIVPPRSRAHVDHVLHPPGHVLLHLEGHRQGLPHPRPRVRLLPWLNWACAEEVIVRSSPHPEIVNELLGVLSLLVSVAPEERGYLRKVHRVL